MRKIVKKHAPIISSGWAGAAVAVDVMDGGGCHPHRGIRGALDDDDEAAQAAFLKRKEAPSVRCVRVNPGEEGKEHAVFGRGGAGGGRVTFQDAGGDDDDDHMPALEEPSEQKEVGGLGEGGAGTGRGTGMGMGMGRQQQQQQQQPIRAGNAVAADGQCARGHERG